LAKAAELAQSREDSHQGHGTAARSTSSALLKTNARGSRFRPPLPQTNLARIEQRLTDAFAAQADLEPLRANIEVVRARNTSPPQRQPLCSRANTKRSTSKMTTADDSLLDAAT
jgi:hypothetical protein